MCIENVQVTDYMIQGLPMNADSLLQGRLPAIDVSEQSCMGIMDTVQLVIQSLLSGDFGGFEPQARRLRGPEVA